jgi:outer membrane cobalamin receptor
MHHLPFVRRFLAAALVLPLAAGCGTLQRSNTTLPTEGKVITYEQIARSGARNAWEALQRTGTHLKTRDSGYAKPSDLSYRGRGSMLLSAAPVIYVDGAQTSDFAQLREIPVSHIELIRIFNGIQGTKYYGTGGGNGVIVVETRTTPLE